MVTIKKSATTGGRSVGAQQKRAQAIDRAGVGSLIILLSDYLSTHAQDFCRQVSGDNHVSASQMRILRYLQGMPHASLTALSHYLGVMNPTSSNIIRRLVKQGLVASEQAAEQRQRIEISLRPAGEALLHQYETNVHSNMDQWFAALRKTDLKAFSKVLRVFIRALTNSGANSPLEKLSVASDSLAHVTALALSITDYLDAFSYRYCRENSEGSQVSRAQLRILGYLSNRPDSSLTELSAYLGIRNPTTTTTIMLLVKQELVERKKTPQLRKRTQLRATEKGERLLKGFRAKLLVELNRAMAALDPEEIAMALKARDALFNAADYNQTISEDKKLFRKIMSVD
jgi:DNA-binding MarR family transcriptional regulator